MMGEKKAGTARTALLSLGISGSAFQEVFFVYQKILAPSVLLGHSGDLEYSQARTSTFLLPLLFDI